MARLQAEKNDLVAMNSELQLKADQDSNDDSFIEIIKVSVRSDTPPPKNPHFISCLYFRTILKHQKVMRLTGCNMVSG